MRYLRLLRPGLMFFLMVLSTILAARSSEATPQDSDELTVYVTKTGTKYHRMGCRHLKRSAIPIKLKDAIKAGYTPCSVCNPPARNRSDNSRKLTQAGQAEGVVQDAGITAR